MCLVLLEFFESMNRFQKWDVEAVIFKAKVGTLNYGNWLSLPLSTFLSASICRCEMHPKHCY